MMVISDASPLISLAAINHLDLLQRLFGQIFIPPAVHSEVCGGRNRMGVPDYIKVQQVSNQGVLQSLEISLHAGESAAIALGLENDGSLIILDDKEARETATRLGIRVIGTLGVLLLAKRRGTVELVEPLIRQLVESVAFRVSPDVLQAVLLQAGENPVN